jgi:hypothetical protein
MNRSAHCIGLENRPLARAASDFYRMTNIIISPFYFGWFLIRCLAFGSAVRRKVGDPLRENHRGA